MTTAIWNSIASALPQNQHAIAAERIKRAESMGLTRIRFFDRLNWSYTRHADDLIGLRGDDTLLWLSDFDYLDTAEA